jgi:predicted transcriptional regulator
MTYDAWLAHNPEDEWLGPEPQGEEEIEPEREEDPANLVRLELDSELLSALERIANLSGRSLEEIIREAVDQFISTNHPDYAIAARSLQMMTRSTFWKRRSIWTPSI